MRHGPPSLTSSGWRFSLFTLLYLYQGIVAGFALTALANHFAAAGVSTADVGRHLAIVGLPWVLQPLLWGPVIDRETPYRMGPRRYWLVLALACAQACLAGLLSLGATPSMTAVSAVLFLHSLAASLADTATDRLIAGSVPTDELGRTSAGNASGVRNRQCGWDRDLRLAPCGARPARRGRTTSRADHAACPDARPRPRGSG